MKTARQNMMEQYILQNGKVSMQSLQDHFQISVNTLRRDLAELEARGTVRKVYGGVEVVKVHRLTSILDRYLLNLNAKEQIGRLAAQFIPDNSTVYIDSGSTTKCVMPHITGRKKLTLITNSLSALQSAGTFIDANIITLGGVYSTSLDTFVDANALDKIRKLSLDIAVMAATGVSIRQGLSNTTYFEAEIKQAVVSKSKRILLLADHTKFGCDAPLQYCPLHQINVLITDQCPPDEYMQYFKRHAIDVVYDEETAALVLKSAGRQLETSKA